MAKKLDNDMVIMALLENESQRAAAAALGIALSTLQNYMKEKDFKDAYAAARAELLQHAYNNLLHDVSGACNDLKEIMHDDDNKPQIRINAINLFFSTILKLHENVVMLEEIEEMKERLKRVESNIEERV